MKQYVHPLGRMSCAVHGRKSPAIHYSIVIDSPVQEGPALFFIDLNIVCTNVQILLQIE